MYYDPVRQAYIDQDTGEVVFQETDGGGGGGGGGRDSVPLSTMLPTSLSRVSQGTTATPSRSRGGGGGLFAAFTSPARSTMHQQYTPTTQQDIEMIPYNDLIRDQDGSDELVITKLDEFERLFDLAAEERKRSEKEKVSEDNLTELERTLYNLHVTNGYDEVLRSPGQTDPMSGLESGTAPTSNTEDANNDWNFARTLQMLEFEITNEGIDNDEYEDFNGKEYRASRSCRRQLATISFLICVVQIALLIAMCEVDGQASTTENPAIGPPAYSMVRFGAKESALIVYKNEW